MKTTFTFLTGIFLTVILAGCSKDPDTHLTKEEQVAQFLSGNGNRVWRLKAIKVNDVPQQLTTAQLMYTKTYTMVAPQTTQGKFTDYDNYYGEWTMLGATAMKEIFQQIGGGGYGKRDYTILLINDNTLNMYYVDNNTKVEELYNAF